MPDGKFPANQPGEAMPALLTYTNIGALEAIQAGTVVQRGPCFYLSGAPEEAVILWPEGTQIVRDAERGVAVELPDGLRLGVGDRIRGGGGALPPAKPISDFASQEVPESCATAPAVQIHSVEIVERAFTDDAGFRSAPPPPPPPAPDFLQSVKERGPGSTGAPIEILGFDDPREALFAHMISGLREGEDAHDRPVCLREVDDALFQSLSSRFERVYRTGACRWQDGGVQLRADGSPAVLVEARLDCDGQSRCLAEGARIFGNMGGEGQGYVMQPMRGGWSIASSGVSWMS
ncbi:hypothetical protein K3179_12820 [Qipengyuania sp. GH38]|uniref:hypothetical protein n=1 Tax=Qipengyuania intermedia TaxID=2867244 RepID=UPI001C868785|nr:hypothetical protein [Qipengyuania intermedia]MBX7515429.1 hypothetical protein [Qipengyuania intermedia]